MTVFPAGRLERGPVRPAGHLEIQNGQHAVEVAITPDGRFAFVSLQVSHQVAVFNLARALTSGFGPADVVGTIPFRTDPVGITMSPDGKYLYVAGGLARPATTSGNGGTLSVVDVAKAETSPQASVLKTVRAGCGPDRMAISPDGHYLWLTVGGGNAVLAYSLASLQSDPHPAPVAKVKVGELPLGLAFVHGGATLIVADSNRDQLPNAGSDLAVVDVNKALAGQKGALAGLIKSGVTPRQFALYPDGTTLLVTNTESGDVQALNIAGLP
jgi:DNA-binding beta-propeller fold protein YncE